MRYFYIGANVRRLMSTMDWPDTPEFKDMVESFEEAFREVVHGSRVFDRLSCHSTAGDASENKYVIDREEPLPLPIYNGILERLNLSSGVNYTSAYALRTSTRNSPTLNPYGQAVASVPRGKITFATAGKGLRNSFVMYRGEGGDSDGLRAGQIFDIYLHSRIKDGKTLVEPFFLLNTYRCLAADDAAKDPYRRWPDIDTRLYYNQFEDDTRIVCMDDIVAHFAAHVYTPKEDIMQECVVVRNLDRVRCFNSIPAAVTNESFSLRLNGHHAVRDGMLIALVMPAQRGRVGMPSEAQPNLPVS